MCDKNFWNSWSWTKNWKCLWQKRFEVHKSVNSYFWFSIVMAVTSADQWLQLLGSTPHPYAQRFAPSCGKNWRSMPWTTMWWRTLSRVIDPITFIEPTIPVNQVDPETWTRELYLICLFASFFVSDHPCKLTWDCCLPHIPLLGQSSLQWSELDSTMKAFHWITNDLLRKTNVCGSLNSIDKWNVNESSHETFLLGKGAKTCK